MFYYLFLLALSLNLILLAIISYLIFKKKPQEPQSKKELTSDASDLLRDLMNGGAIAVVKVIDPSSIFLQSPRDL
jgi:hypothetical protein